MERGMNKSIEINTDNGLSADDLRWIVGLLNELAGITKDSDDRVTRGMHLGYTTALDAIRTATLT